MNLSRGKGLKDLNDKSLPHRTYGDHVSIGTSNKFASMGTNDEFAKAQRVISHLSI